MLSAAAQAQDDQRGLNGIAEVEFSQLSDQTVSPLGIAALAIHPDQWKHGETQNFVYHFNHGFVATPVSIEAEYYYRVIAKDLGRDTSQWERKSHIYLFEKPEDWAEFQKKASLEPWTGGIHSGGDLFIPRNPENKFKGRTLGHEITHLVLFRFFGAGIPLWLNEGFAEYESIQGYAAFQRERGYAAHPRSQTISEADYIPLEKLTAFATYPDDQTQVLTFYAESEKLVRFLTAEDREKFVLFLDALSRGNRLETALGKTYGARFPDLHDLDGEFKKYATSPL